MNDLSEHSKVGIHYEHDPVVSPFVVMWVNDRKGWFWIELVPFKGSGIPDYVGLAPHHKFYDYLDDWKGPYPTSTEAYNAAEADYETR